MDSARSSHWWLSTFAARLIQLNPNVTAPSAIRRAVAHYDKAAHLDPGYAAEIYVRQALTADAERRSDTRRSTAKPTDHRSVLLDTTAADDPSSDQHASPVSRRSRALA